MVKGVAVIEACMDEGSGYCGSGGGIESVSDAAKIANMVMGNDRHWKGMKSVWRTTVSSRI